MEIDYESLKKEVKEIIDICNTLPKEYQEKCFEILLNRLISSQKNVEQDFSEDNDSTNSEDKATKKPASSFKMPFDVRAFITQYNIAEDKINKLFYIEDNDNIRPVFNLKTTKKTSAQIQLALLIALENALKNGKFEFSTETVKTQCIEHKCYDLKNFATYFKKRESLFKSLSDLEHIELNPEGKQLLADTIFELAA